MRVRFSFAGAFMGMIVCAHASNFIEDMIVVLQDQAPARPQATTAFVQRDQIVPLSETEWQLLERKILESVKVINHHYSQNFCELKFQQKIADFRLDFCHLLGSAKVLKRSVPNTQAIRKLLNQYCDFLKFATHAHDMLMKEVNGAFNTPYYATTKKDKVYDDHDDFLRAFYHLSDIVHANIVGQKLLAPDETLKLISTQQGHIGFIRDECGLIPYCLPLEDQKYFISHITWGRYEHSAKLPALLYYGDRLIEEAGLVVINERNQYLKLLGYLGAKNAEPFTVSRATFRVSTLDSSMLLTALKKLCGPRLENADSAHFVPMPGTAEEWGQLETLFIEDLIQSAKDESDPDHAWAKQYLIELPPLKGSEIPSFDQQGEKELTAQDILSLPVLLLEEKEQGPEKEGQPKTHEEPKVLPSETLNSGQNMKLQDASQTRGTRQNLKGKKKPYQKPKRKGGRQTPSAQASSNASVVSKDEAAEREALYEQFKVNTRIKYSKLLTLLREIAKNSPHIDLSVHNQKGSHINLHGEGGGMTIVRPHGRRDQDVKPYVVNSLLKKMLSLGESNS